MIEKVVFLQWDILGLFSVYLSVSFETLQILRQKMSKSFHPVYDSGIRTRSHWQMAGELK